MQVARSIAALVFLVTTLTTRADITLAAAKNVRKKVEPAISAPESVPVKVTVRSGGTVEIPLRVFGAPDVGLAYQAFSLPEFGKLSAAKMVGRGIGVMTYRHSGERTPDHDRFSYVSTRGRSVSQPAEVEITIIDDPPKLSAVDSLDFGSVTIGSTVTREITIENRGGGKLKGSISIDAPWKIDGPANYQLRAGERQTFSVNFAPPSEATFRAPLRYSSHPGQTTVFHAVAQSAIGVNPQRLELQPTQDATRTGILTIVNRTDEQLPLRLHLGRGFSGAENVTLPARGQISVTIATALGEVQAVDGVLRLESPSFETSIPVHAPAAGPMIHALPATVSLGKIDHRRPVIATLQITNAGGLGTQVRLETPDSVLVPPGESSFWLEAGATKNLHVSVGAPNEGSFRAVLVVKASGTEVQIPVVAEVESAPPATGTTPTAERKAEAGPLEGTSEPDRIPAVLLNAEITRITATTCELEWPSFANGSWQYRLESRSARLEAPWVAMPHVAIKPAGKASRISAGSVPAGSSMTAQLSHLSPRTAYEIRVVALDAAGAATSTSFPMEFQTTPRFTLTSTLRFVVPASLLLGAFVLLQRGRRNGHDFVSESPATRKTPPSPTVPKPPASNRAGLPVTRKGPAPTPAAPRNSEIFGTRKPQPSSSGQTAEATSGPPPADRRQVPFMREIEPGRHEIFFRDES